MDLQETQAFALSTLEALGGAPAVPFHEHLVARVLWDRLRESGVDVSVDDYGNVLATRRGTDTDAPGLAIVAHMDHPGFEAVAAQGDVLEAEVRGGITRQAIEPGIAVTVVAPDGSHIPGVISDVDGEGRTAKLKVEIEATLGEIGVLPRPVVLAMPDFEIDGDLIRMRALDDLGGCASAAAAVVYALDHPSPGAVYALFTRAEEIGHIGARVAAEARLLPTDTRVISAETSHTLPGAEIGDGVVIRTGDIGTTFDDAAETYLRVAAMQLTDSSAGKTDIKIGRQLMKGGSCEASSFAAFGYSATGIAYSLGNWHNGLMQEVVEPEHIHMNDFRSGVALLAKAVELAGTEPRSRSAEYLGQRPVAEAERLSGVSRIELR